MTATRAEINLEIQESIWASLITELEDDCKSPSPTPIDDVDPNPSSISPGADATVRGDLSMPIDRDHGSGSHQAGGGQEKEVRASSSFAAGFGIPSTAAPPLIFSIGSSSSVNSLSTKHNISTWGNHIWDNATLGVGSGRGGGFSGPRRPFPIGGLTGAGAALKSPFPMPLDIQMSQRQHQPALPASISLSGWIDYHKNNKSRGENMNTSTSSGGGSLGRTNTNGPLSLRGRPNNKIDEEYLKSGVRIALSLTVKVKEIRKQQQLNQQMNVCLENVMVVDTAEGLCDLNTSTNMGVSTITTSEPSLIFALGKLFYAIFSQGSKLPESESEALTCTSGKSKGSGRGELNLGRTNTRGANNSKDAVMMSQQQDDEEEDEETLRKQRRRRRDTNNPRVEITTSLERHKVPYSIIRVLADMLANTPTSSELMGASLTPDNAITSLDDVECDLRQMNTLPKRFLFDSLLMRFKPVIQDKLYCREKEMKSALGVAERVFCSHRGELNELQDDVGGVKQEVLMLIGDAGECMFTTLFSLVSGQCLTIHIM